MYTLGECVTETFPSDFGGPDTIRSAVVLYYGSFLRLSRLDPDFDWDEELWETLTHELQHHLESLAADESLVDLDYAVDQGFLRQDGEPFDALYYRAGDNLGDGWFQIEKELFLERTPTDDTVEFALDDETYAMEVPELTADVTFVTVGGGLPADAPRLTVVLLRPRTWRAALAGAHRPLGACTGAQGSRRGAAVDRGSSGAPARSAPPRRPRASAETPPAPRRLPP